MSFCKKNRKKLGKGSRMIFAVFDGFGAILMVFIDQNMRIHDFHYLGGILIDILMILEQILFNKLGNSIFFEKLLRYDPKIIFL